VRSIAHALGGHCTTLRRTAVGPFDVSEAVPVDDVQLSSADAALRRLPESALGRVEDGIRAGVLAVEAGA
jgi:tRNA U55 pseudouridine synthase TruB